MAKLVLTADGKVVDQYFIDKASLTIGRETGNDIVIDDPQLSRVHARITSVGEDDIAEDLQSRNGTQINGRPLGRHILQHRDVIELGRHQLRYMSSRTAADVELDRTMIIRGPVLATAADASPVKPVGALSTRTKLAGGSVTLLATTASHAEGEAIRLERVVTTFGIPGKALLVLTRRPQGVFLMHVEGQGFPKVGRQSIGSSAYALRDGDIIEGAGYRLKFSAG